MRHFFLHCSLSATNATEKCRLKTVRHENRKTSEALIVNDFGRYSCGGRIFKNGYIALRINKL